MNSLSNPVLPLGYSPVAPGQLANAVTCLEMKTRPEIVASDGLPPHCRLERLKGGDRVGYRDLYRKVGQPWLWTSRLEMPDDALEEILADARVQAYALCAGQDRVGLLELDFRAARECELAFFGIAPRQIGKGLGRALMETAIRLAWTQPIDRFWVHTCTFDHPKALEFYVRSGFRPYAFQIEVLADPRLTGRVPRSAAPHIPLLEGDAQSAAARSTGG